MPFCPKCRYEYVDGIEVCLDCDLKLVAKLHEEHCEPEPDVNIITVAMFYYPQEAEMAKLHLEANGIESMIVGGIVARTVRLYGGLAGQVQLQVREEDAPLAVQILSEQ